MSDRERDPYRELGIGRDATAADIARAWRRLARAVHPDSRPGDPAAAAQFRAVSDAYGLLSDPARRAAWDHQHPTRHPLTSDGLNLAGIRRVLALRERNPPPARRDRPAQERPPPRCRPASIRRRPLAPGARGRALRQSAAAGRLCGRQPCCFVRHRRCEMSRRRRYGGVGEVEAFPRPALALVDGVALDAAAGDGCLEHLP
jgi:DnaJ domain